MIKECIQKLVERRDLSFDEADNAMEEVMSGKASNAQIAALLIALRMKGETTDEIAAFATAMRKFCRRIHPIVNGRLLDTCGTGGDRMNTFNISTIAAFVVAGAGVNIAKHGNRSITSACGSADVLERLGLNLNSDPQIVEKTIEDSGIGFIFAPSFHPAMRNVSAPRRETGVRTIFNILGPLTNPAGADTQILGVYDESLVEPLSLVLRKLGCKEAMIVHGLDGLDEITITGRTVIAWLSEGNIALLNVSPESLGLKKAKIEEIQGGSVEYNTELSYKILNNSIAGSKKDIVLVNAAAGVIVGGKASDFNEGLEIARKSIESGAAYGKLRELVKACGDIATFEEVESRYG
ncbi:MAG: anthranilate phosphoribosyltransferase [Thermoproteota archaeon]|nr:anthranilate phosphoribosyltransferase [Thermoproteota archaeon]